MSVLSWWDHREAYNGYYYLLDDTRVVGEHHNLQWPVSDQRPEELAKLSVAAIADRIVAVVIEEHNRTRVVYMIQGTVSNRLS